MKTSVDQTGGVVTQFQSVGAGVATTVRQPAEKVLDVSAFEALYLALCIYSFDLGTGVNSGNSPLLILETAMQNDDPENPVWVQLASVNLYDSFDTANWNAVVGISITSGALSYLRWRLSIPSRGAAFQVNLVFQITGYGRS